MKIALDVDDVLAGFTQHCHSYFGAELKGTFNFWSVEDCIKRYGEGWLEKVFSDEEFYRTLPILSPPEDINFDVECYMTSIPVHLKGVRERWLSDNGYPEAEVFVTMNKIPLCKHMKIDVLVDDKPHTITALKGQGVRGIHFIPHYAGFDPVGEHITNLNQLKKIL